MSQDTLAANVADAIIIGGRCGLGGALVRTFLTAFPTSRVVSTSRSAEWVAADDRHPNETRVQLDVRREADFKALASRVSETAIAPNVVIYVPGVLHTDGLQPERRWSHLDPDSMIDVFSVNTFGPALCIKYCLDLLPKKGRAWFASISARVGSIGDNRLGGWYSYRASKAAQNMLIKTAAIEAGRLRPDLACVSLHPGTVDTDLSKPFSTRVPMHKLFTADESAGKLWQVLLKRTGSDTGQFFAWDGSRIEW